MILGTIFVCHQIAIILFDQGSIYYYVLGIFFLDFDVIRDMLDAPIYVSTLLESPL